MAAHPHSFRKKEYPSACTTLKGSFVLSPGLFGRSTRRSPGLWTGGGGLTSMTEKTTSTQWPGSTLTGLPLQRPKKATSWGLSFAPHSRTSGLSLTSRPAGCIAPERLHVRKNLADATMVRQVDLSPEVAGCPGQLELKPTHPTIAGSIHRVRKNSRCVRNPTPCTPRQRRKLSTYALCFRHSD